MHLGSRAVGGAGLVLTEATAVLPEGRISPQDLGIWSDAHVEALARIVSFVHGQGSVAGIQLAHAGRKASMRRPWDGPGLLLEHEGGWSKVVAPSAMPYADGYPTPQALTTDGIQEVIAGFVAAAGRARAAGFGVIEIHAAHGYLIHEFLSPLSNQRQDAYGGSFENRTRLLREVVAALRRVWPDRAPLFVRISATDWVEGGWDLEQSIELARGSEGAGRRLDRLLVWREQPPGEDSGGPGLSGAIRGAHSAGRRDPDRRGRHDHVICPGRADCATGHADAVIIARELLRDPVLAAARRARARSGRVVARPIPQSRAGGHAGSRARRRQGEAIAGARRGARRATAR